MGRNRSSGLRKRGGTWHIDKQVLGHRIHESTGTSELKTAELMLARRIEQIRQASVFGIRPVRIFREAATRFLEENTHLATIRTYAFHLKELDSYIGDLPLYQVHMGTLQAYIDRRKKEGKKNKTVNGALATVRRVLNLSARLWRDEHGLTWLETAPLIQMLPLHDARRPYPLSWEEQHRLFKALPDHLSRMCLFKVNTGCRDGEVCSLRWEWEIDVPELGTSVFLIPGERVKNREEMLLTLAVVVNHASNQHEWTQRARRGEQTYIDYFYIFDNRDIPDLFEETMVGSRCGESWRCPYGYTT